MKHIFLFSLFIMLLSGCDRDNNAPEDSSKAVSEVAMTVYKSPTCGCCAEWVEHVEQGNFKVSVNHAQNLDAVKQELGLKRELHSCHTGVTEEGYVFEGHIPVKTIKEFLRNPPEDALGLAVPGMPYGSPGMAVNDRFEPYSVLLVKKDGSTETYRRFEAAAEQY